MIRIPSPIDTSGAQNSPFASFWDGNILYIFCSVFSRTSGTLSSSVTDEQDPNLLGRGGHLVDAGFPDTT